MGNMFIRLSFINMCKSFTFRLTNLHEIIVMVVCTEIRKELVRTALIFSRFIAYFVICHFFIEEYLVWGMAVGKGLRG